MIANVCQYIVAIHFNPLLVFTGFAEFFVFLVIYFIGIAMVSAWEFLTCFPVLRWTVGFFGSGMGWLLVDGP